MLDFLGIGAQKAGTTWIYENLRHHPEVKFPSGKEIHFWDWHRDRGIEWYKGLFTEENLGKKQGEITPAYAFLDKDTIRKIYELNPKMRLIFSVRDPIARAWSSAKMALQRAEMTMEEASDQWFLDHFHSQGSLKRGDYLRCLSNWLAVFPKEQLLIVHYDDIAANPDNVLRQCCEHIGVDPAFFAKKNLLIEQQKLVNQGMVGSLRPSLLEPLRRIYDEKSRAFEAVVKTLGNKSYPIQHFVILFQGRTGSTMLTEHLASHPCIIAEVEHLVRKTEKEQCDWMEGLYSGTANPVIQAVGFKTKLRDVVNPDSFRALLEKRHVKVIYLRRENLVKMALSRVNAKRLFDEKKQWNLLPSQQQLPPAHITIEQFNEALNFKHGLHNSLQKFIDTLKVPVLPITYEMLLESPQAVFTSVFDFLGVPFYPLQSNIKKNTPDNLREAILNFDEIKEYYKGTEFEMMFG